MTEENPNTQQKNKSEEKNSGKIALLLILATGLVAAQLFLIGKSFTKIQEPSSLIGQLTSSSKKIKGEKEKRTNVLFLGMGGQNHEGAELTDTIMVASIKYEDDNSKKVALISFPRDLYINLKNSGNIKINALYSLNKDDDRNQKNQFISRAISDITGLPIHYYVQVDFEGFKKAVDALGGVDVNVERSFYDSMYPTDNFGYQTIRFDQGQTHMDGDLALKYARSRHGVVIDDSGGYEASDFARAKRQQQILFAAKDKIISLNTILNPSKINELLEILGDHVATNLQLWELLKIANYAKSFDTSTIKNNVIDDSPNGLLFASTAQDGSFVVLPKSNGFSEIHAFCNNIFESEEEKTEQANLQILNGTNSPGLASQVAATIPFENINIVDMNNSDRNDYKKTIIYDYSNGQKTKTVNFLKNRFDAKIIKTNSLPTDLQDLENKPNITLVIGQNYLQLPKYQY